MVYVIEIITLINLLTGNYMINFKTPQVAKEFYGAPKMLQMLAVDIDNRLERLYDKHLFITRIRGKVGIKESGVHQEYLAFDGRDQHWTNDGWKRLFTDEEAKEIVDYCNRNYKRIDNHCTCIHHGGTALHFHFQLPHKTIDLRSATYSTSE